ncbi:Pentatricopeptide repeat-containing protein [Camellia lanceoleosa]|uniref:Pentatricopeptide repeat-containing protein n=1 Tax=Camellia lanceoleosa TaxID=1840588 RepID=A0ACC0I2F6_9ERIC|nr:Pentatricopeptide repeat-containing protein [Camellia lanceoleosa]
MTTKHQIDPKLELYGSIIDLLGRSGCVKEAHDLIRTMPMNPNATIWGALLSACRTHDNMELAESAVKELIDLEPLGKKRGELMKLAYKNKLICDFLVTEETRSQDQETCPLSLQVVYMKVLMA